jgi:hypothetical protein
MAKRRLSNFNFESEGSHIALVHRDQGGPANGVDYALICKATKDITTKEVEKATEVTVTMNIVDFLCKFFGLWYDDALVLAMVMGYDVGDAGYSFVEASTDYEDYLQERVDAINIMKALVLDKDVEDIKKAVGELSPQDYLKVIEAQQVFEKNFEAATEKVAVLKKSSGVTTEGVIAEKSALSPSVEINKKEDDMSEFISKAAMDVAVQEAVQKAVGEVQVELTKAQEIIKKYEEEKTEAVAKARKEAIATVEKDEAKAEELFKTLNPLEQEAFESVIKALKAKDEVVENSDLFVQKSKDVNEETKPVSFKNFLPTKNK